MDNATARQTDALGAAMRLGDELGPRCEAARMIKVSNNTIIHLAPAPVIAKVGTSTLRSDAALVLAQESDVGQFLAGRGAPIAKPTSEAPSGPHLRNGTVITLWTHYQNVLDADASEEDLAHLLTAFHEAFVGHPGELPDFTENLTRARDALGDASRTPDLPDADRAFLIDVSADVGARLRHFDMDARPLQWRASSRRKHPPDESRSPAHRL